MVELVVEVVDDVVVGAGVVVGLDDAEVVVDPGPRFVPGMSVAP